MVDNIHKLKILYLIHELKILIHLYTSFTTLWYHTSMIGKIIQHSCTSKVPNQEVVSIRTIVYCHAGNENTMQIKNWNCHKNFAVLSLSCWLNEIKYTILYIEAPVIISTCTCSHHALYKQLCFKFTVEIYYW